MILERSILGRSILGTILGKSLSCLFRLLNDKKGQDLIEYAMIVALIVLAAIVSMGTLGTAIDGMWTNIAGRLTAAI